MLDFNGIYEAKGIPDAVTALMADEKAVHEIAQRYPGVDLQHLRSLRRAALKEQEQNKPPRSYRALFQRLKELENAVEADRGASTPESSANEE